MMSWLVSRKRREAGDRVGVEGECEDEGAREMVEAWVSRGTREGGAGELRRKGGERMEDGGGDHREWPGGGRREEGGGRREKGEGRREEGEGRRGSRGSRGGKVGAGSGVIVLLGPMGRVQNRNGQSK